MPDMPEITPFSPPPALIKADTAKPVNKALPYMALGAGILSLSMSALFVKWAQAPGVVTSFYRMSLAALIMVPFFLRHVRSMPGKRLPSKWIWLPILSGLFHSLDHGVWSTSLSYTSVANATLLNNTSPLWVALFAFFVWKERLNKRFWVGLALTLSGAAIVFGNDVLKNPHLGFGDFLGMASSFFFAGYYLVTQRGRSYFGTLPYFWIVTLCSSVFLLSYTFAFGAPLTGYPLSTYLTFLFAALVSQVIGSFSLTFALGHLPASVVAPTMILQPMLSALLAIPLAGEPLSPAQWVGGAAVLAGIYWVNRQ
ncbi:MAG: DMT family transporter [Anaerolineaceae bacterium]|nr:DMT family transporter [Anaerolineaceae bacterium]